MTVNIIGTMTPEDAVKLRAHLGYSFDPGDSGWDRFGPLSFDRDQTSICGLGSWPAPAIDRVGNLAERNYDPENVADHLRELVTVAGSMLLKVHCGAEYESTRCVATVSVGEGVVAVGKPEVEQLKPLDEGQMTANLLRASFGGSR